MSRSYTLGVRVEISGAEWCIRCVDRTGDDSELLSCLVDVYLAQTNHKNDDAVSKKSTATTQATGQTERTITYQAIFFKPNREEDYATAWAFFKDEK